MVEKKGSSKSIKIFGCVYLILNCAIWITLVSLVIHTALKTPGLYPGWVYLIFPTLGVFSGWWIWKGTYNSLKRIIIGLSLVFSLLLIVFLVLVGPELKKLEDIAPDNAISKAHKPNPLLDKLFMAMDTNDLNAVKELIAQGEDINIADESGKTALHITQNDDMARLLIQSGADVNARNIDYNMTPIFNKEVHLSKILVEAGADINVRSDKGNTPLMWYCYSGYLEGIKYMVSLGADINIKNIDGKTAYDIAEHFYPLELLPYLKLIGAKPAKEIK